jgi:hypothetical protein
MPIGICSVAIAAVMTPPPANATAAAAINHFLFRTFFRTFLASGSRSSDAASELTAQSSAGHVGTIG